jgi:hypothetical protein
VGGQVGVGELGQRHLERAAAELLGGDVRVDLVEDRQDLVARIGPGLGDQGLHQVPVDLGGVLDVGADQSVLRGEQAVQGRRGDLGPGRDQIDASGPDALAVEQVPRDLEHVGPGLSGGSWHGVPLGIEMLGIVPLQC